MSRITNLYTTLLLERCVVVDNDLALAESPYFVLAGCASSMLTEELTEETFADMLSRYQEFIDVGEDTEAEQFIKITCAGKFILFSIVFAANDVADACNLAKSEGKDAFYGKEENLAIYIH